MSEHQEQKIITERVQGDIVSGFYFPTFTKSKKAHYFEDVTSESEPMIAYGERLRVVRSLCGIETLVHSKRQPLFSSVEFERCKRCERLKGK